MDFFFPSDLKKPQNKSVTEDLGLQQHDVTHTSVQDKESGLVVALLTSSKGNNQPDIHFEKVDSIKANNTFIPLKDPKTKQPLLDSNGQPIPDPNKGGQYLAVFDKPRKIGKALRPQMEERKDIQSYLDKHENKIKSIIENKQIVVGKLKRKLLEDMPNNNEIVSLTGFDTHINVAVEDPENENYLYIIGYCTSTKSDETIILSENQEVTYKEKKEQRWRSCTRLIRVEKSDFEQKGDFQAFIEKDNIFQKIKEDLEQKWSLIQINDIEHPINFTFNLLKRLIIISYKEIISENIKNIEEFYKLNKQEQNRIETKRKSQKNNEIKRQLISKFKKTLNDEEKVYFDYKIQAETLEKHAENKNKSKESKNIIIESNDIPE